MKQSQKGSAMVEYIIGTGVVLILIFGIQINDKTLWQMFQDAFSTRHDNYAQTITSLDNVDATKGSKP